MKTFKKLVLLSLIATIIPANIFPLKITDEDLVQFDHLLKDLSNDNVEELDLSGTKIDDFQLADILNRISENLRTLNLRWCYNLHNFKAIKNCTQLQVLNLSDTDINDKQLEDILNQIDGNLKILNFMHCYKLCNFK